MKSIKMVPENKKNTLRKKIYTQIKVNVTQHLASTYYNLKFGIKLRKYEYIKKVF